MDIKDIPQPLKRFLETVFSPNSYGNMWAEGVHASLETDPKWPELFKKQLKELILKRSLSVREYQQITGHHFANVDSLYEFLHERWNILYKQDLIFVDDSKII